MNIKTQCPTCDGDGRADEPYALESVGSVEFAQLRELTETQAQIIAAKNREIATLAAEIRRLQANDYAGDLVNDSKAGLIDQDDIS